METIRRLSIYAFYLWIFLLPWQVRYLWRLGSLNGGYWEYGTISVYGVDLLLLLFFSFSCIGLRGKGSVLPRSIWYWLAGLESVAFIGIFWSVDHQLAIYRYALFLAGVGIIYFLTSGMVKREQAVSAFLYGLIAPAILSVWQFFSQSGFGCKWLGLAYQSADRLGAAVIETSDGGRWLRAYGSFDHPNILGAAMAIGVLLLTWKISSREPDRRKARRWIDLLILMVLSVSCFISFSRAALVGLFFGMSALVIFSRRWGGDGSLKRILVVCIFLSLLSGALVAVNHELVFSRMTVSRLEEKSRNERMTGYGEAFDLIKADQGLGTGLGNYGIALSTQVRRGESSFYYQPAHDVYLMIISELGILGFIAWGGFILSMIFYIWRQRDILGMAMFACLSAMFLFDHWWWSLHFGNMLMWFLMAIAVMFERKEERV